MEAQNSSPYGALATVDTEKTALFEGVLHGSPAEGRAAGLQANNEIWKLLLLSLGGGAAARGALGLSHMFQPKSDYVPTPSYQAVDMPVPAHEEEEEKAASDVLADTYKALTNLTSGPWGKSVAFGKGATEPAGVPAFWPLAGLASIGGGIAGWKGTDAVLDRRRKAEIDDELQQAREEYAQLLAATMAKHGEAVIEDALDELADAVTAPREKRAAPTVMDGAGMAGGWLATYALLSALMSGKLSYDYFRKRNQKSIAEEALKRRAKERSGGVSPIYLQAKELPAAPKPKLQPPTDIVQ